MAKQPQQYDSVEEGLRIIKELKITKSAFAHSICERYRVFNTMTYDEMMRCTLRDLVKYRIDCERQLEEKYKERVKVQVENRASEQLEQIKEVTRRAIEEVEHERFEHDCNMDKENRKWENRVRLILMFVAGFVTALVVWHLFG